VIEAGLVWRYVPAGTFVMGSDRGDPDERPVHPRRVAAFWITDVPITWVAYCLTMGWSPPSAGWPPESGSESIERFPLGQRNKIRMRYCRGELVAAYDWRAHILPGRGEPATPETSDFQRYATRPMVAVAIEECELLAARLTTTAFRIALPSEAQWEKAARGGLVGARFSWGDQPAVPARCDFDHFGAFHLVGMCGGVWEWTRDGYDALAYRDPASSAGPTTDRVLRGGSWSDCAEACTVSYRMSRAVDPAPAPNIGFRLVREAI
jgi:formylglycine-generating enzyme required for sulfatase activity